MRTSMAKTRTWSWETVRKCDSRVVVGGLFPGGAENREAVLVMGVDMWWIVKENEDGRRDSRRVAIAEGGDSDEADGEGNDWDDSGEAMAIDGDGRIVKRRWRR